MEYYKVQLGNQATNFLHEDAEISVGPPGLCPITTLQLVLQENKSKRSVSSFTPESTLAYLVRRKFT